jgi:DNA-directed RNA polymerase subunit RPC12/RpoP
MIETCKWEKLANGYRTECGHMIQLRLRDAIFCPYCSGKIVKSRSEYQSSHYRANKLKEKKKKSIEKKMMEYFRKQGYQI